jgi:hypothetical protein
MDDETRSKLDGLVQALGFWAGAADVVTRFARGVELTDEEERRLHLVTYAGVRIGEPLLRAENEKDHLARIRAATLELELFQLSTLGLRWTVDSGVAPVFERAQAPAMAEVFGRGAIPVLHHGDQIAAYTLDALFAHAFHSGGRHIHVQTGDLLEVLCSGAFPEDVRNAAWCGLEAAACFAAMALAVVTRREIRPRIATTLAERWFLGQGCFLWLLASMPGVTVPEEVVPADRRFDLERLFDEAGARTNEPHASGGEPGTGAA